MVFDGLEQVGVGTEHMALGVIVHCWDSGLRRQWQRVVVCESEDFEGRDSGWTLDEILRLEVRTNRYSPFRGSSSFIEVPKQIAETKAIMNVINKKDSQCFMWSILAALYPNTNNPNKTSSYVPHLNKLKFDGISFPTPLNELRFLDSFKFMSSSLENLIKTLKKDEFKYMKHYFDSEKIDLLLRKGVFPYDYFDSFEKCKDSCLPPISKFYNKLNEEAISVEDYNHACKVFNEFHLNKLGEYCDLYVKTDVLLLTDLFENFRKICMQTYKLDPCWYFTTPALSWDAMLLHTKVAIELFTDYDMLLFIEKGVRGGISQCCNRYAIANNRYMSNFNPDDEIKYLMYLDANNLYGFAMSKYLPLKDFVWSDNDLTEQDILNLSDESDVGYILEVDLEYPSDLHDKHSDFPLAPENKPPPNCKEPRLLTTLEPKTKYVLHYSNLKLYLKLGSKIKANAGEKQLNTSVGTKQLNSTGENNSTRQHERTTQLGSKNETTQLASRNETTQLVSRNETTQLCTAIDRLHRLYSRIGFFYLLTCTEQCSYTQEESQEQLFQHRDNLRREAKQNILKIQEENRITYNRKRKEAHLYKKGDLVAVMRTQFGNKLKLRIKYFGPYQVTKVKPHDRYDVAKIGNHEGPNATSVSADQMKPWT
ncbi:uncharacterized protein TNCV_3818811 [Trichonephila clavipes]|nr:uncharacterized protein TNCV_3818811 [Trichonephila clavipes]